MIRRPTALILTVLLALPVRAETPPPAGVPPAAPPASETERGFSLMEEGAKILLEQMLRQAEPALRDMQQNFGSAVTEIAPVLRDLALMAGDLKNYDPPVRLPNGDILLRRKTAADLAQPQAGPEIEL